MFSLIFIVSFLLASESCGRLCILLVIRFHKVFVLEDDYKVLEVKISMFVITVNEVYL